MTAQTEIVLQEIESLINSRGYGSFTLRVEIMKPNRFVTGCMTFDQKSVAEGLQTVLDYSTAILGSFTRGAEMWRDFATRLLTGKLEIAGTVPLTDLSYSNMNDELYLGGQNNHPRQSFLFSQPGFE